MSSLSVSAPAMHAEHLDAAELRRMVRHDQMVAVRHSVLAAIPINAVLTVAALLMAYSGGELAMGVVWAMLSALVNITRAIVCRLPYRGPQDAPSGEPAAPALSGRWWRTRSVEWHLRAATLLGLCSGLVWAMVPLLCDGYTSPQTLFYLTVVCGITAGSVTYGIAYAWVPIFFITPALLSVAACLLVAGGFERQMLALMVFVYLAALIRSGVQSEAAFKRGSRLKNEATAMADRLRQAHESSQAAARELEFRAMHDPLTRLFNRDGFADAAGRRLAAAGEREQCLLMLDLDGFKAINDVFGHGVGDRVLQDVGRWLSKELERLDAVVGRWGGDEFVVLYDVPGSAQSPEQLARLLTQRIPQASVMEGGQLGVSVGLCVGRGLGVMDMLTFADEALYSAKRAGGDSFRFFDHGLQQALMVRRDVERDLGMGLETGGVVLWYQPIFTAGGELHSFEALLRWLHPRHGWVSPEQIVHAAAATGLARRLLNHVLTQVCLAARQLDAAGMGHLPLAVNVSPREMAHLDVDDLVLDTLQRHGVPPRRLQLEITEEVALNAESTQGKLARLAAAGVAISIDDFGVGYSSLASLRGDHVRQVKIDRSFISGLDASRDNRLLVGTILQMGRSLGIDVVAEGVERVEELMALRALQCPLMQGYHLCRPAPLDEIVHTR
ncbi:EAL domain-containing protein [Pseudacidovorax sp.]|uniref:putative bifunctional diguanylate cyclase/phosphodiesterase n=1 Tax=Pseudacidovorax sp. TaxID=1934311 RepID=UPI0025F2380B|nr:EAL domain-containing protein [Pseudacidovorax sp.]